MAQVDPMGIYCSPALAARRAPRPRRLPDRSRAGTPRRNFTGSLYCCVGTNVRHTLRYTPAVPIRGRQNEGETRR